MGKGKGSKAASFLKAKKAAQANKKGTSKFKRKLRRTVHFKLKPTLKTPRAPKYAKKVNHSLV